MDICHGPDPMDMQKGAYLLLNPHKGYADCAVIHDEAMSDTFSRVALRLSVQGITVRLIAVSDFALFEQQDEAYRAKVLRRDVPLFKASTDGSLWANKVDAPMLPSEGEAALADSIKSLLSPK